VIAETKTEFRSLFAEFAKAYLTTPQGEEHLTFYADGRSKGLANLSLNQDDDLKSTATRIAESQFAVKLL
jgi:hypothetical protein